MEPNRPGWYWFLPDEGCPTPTGLLRINKPVVVLVGAEPSAEYGTLVRLVVRFPNATLSVDDMSGDWEKIKEPRWMQKKAKRREHRRRSDGKHYDEKY